MTVSAMQILWLSVKSNMEHLMHQRTDSYYNPRHHKVCGPSIQTYQCLHLGKTLRLKKGGGGLFYTTVEELNGKKIKHCTNCCSLGTLTKEQVSTMSGFRVGGNRKRAQLWSLTDHLPLTEQL